MAPFPRQRRRRVPVEELLSRLTGDHGVAADAGRHRPAPEHRHRPAGDRDKRTTHDVLRLSAGAAAVVATVCVTVFAATSSYYSESAEPVAPPSLSLQPAVAQPSVTTFASPAPTSAPDAVTFSAPPTSAPAPKPHRPAAPTASAAPVPVRPASCTVRFTITDSWPGGYTASVGITNTGGAALSPWTLTWKFAEGQHVTHGWDGEYSQSGTQVTVHPASYNPTIAAGATNNIGFNGSFTSANPAPTGFTLNGTRCTG